MVEKARFKTGRLLLGAALLAAVIFLLLRGLHPETGAHLTPGLCLVPEVDFQTLDPQTHPALLEHFFEYSLLDSSRHFFLKGVVLLPQQDTLLCSILNHMGLRDALRLHRSQPEFQILPEREELQGLQGISLRFRRGGRVIQRSLLFDPLLQSVLILDRFPPYGTEPEENWSPTQILSKCG